jgi:hypothetical protein
MVLRDGGGEQRLAETAASLVDCENGCAIRGLPRSGLVLGTSAPPAEWRDLGFDDSSWLSGPTGIGYGDGDDATVLRDMRGKYTTVFMRRTFDLADASAVKALELAVRYDDGFAAFVNGTRVAASGADRGIGHRSTASRNHEAGGFETFDITALARGALKSGENVIAIVVLNTKAGSSDLSMVPTLKMWE